GSLDHVPDVVYFKLPSARFIIIGTNGLNHLRDGEAIVCKFVWIDRNLVLFFEPSKGGHLGNSRHILQSEFYIPVLYSTLFTQIHAGCFQCIPQNMAYTGAIRTNGWNNTLRQ